MTALWVVVLTLVPVVAGGALGQRRGALRLATAAARLAIVVAAALGTLLALASGGVFWPLGLVTPAVAALAVAGVVAAVARQVTRRLARRAAERDGYGGPETGAARVRGAVTGGVIGALTAGSLWTAALLAHGLVASSTSTTAPHHSARADAVARLRPAHERPIGDTEWRVRGLEEATGDGAPSHSDEALDPAPHWAEELLDLAHRGFVTHLPLVGPVADETRALVEILEAPRAERERLGRAEGWEAFGELPEVRDLITDPEVRETIAEIESGDLWGLYTLQRDERLLRFASRPEVRALLASTRPTTLLRRLESLRDE